MKIIIAGSRTFNDYELFEKIVNQFNISSQTDVIVSGGARGVDSLANQYARENSIPLKVFKADWNKHGKAAGPIRNKIMAENSDVLIAFWFNNSRGTKNMIDQMQKLNKQVVIVTKESIHIFYTNPELFRKLARNITHKDITQGI